MPRVFTWNDIDGALYRRETKLLRFFEHKSPGQKKEFAQFELLGLISRIVEHVKGCQEAQRPSINQIKLHEYSGVYLIESDPTENNQLGPSKVTRLHDDQKKTFVDEEEMLCWIALLNNEHKHRDYIRNQLARRKCA